MGPFLEKNMKRDRVTLSTLVDRNILESLRNYVYWKPGETITNIVENLIKEFMSTKNDIPQRPSLEEQGIGKRL